MNDTHLDFIREPSVPHQCLHTHYKDGRRCRATAMHNNYMCFAHRDKVIPPVYENEPFEIPTTLTRDTIQQALGNLAALLACNRMDFKRAGLLAYILQIASCNLPDPVPTSDGAPQNLKCHPEAEPKDLSSSPATEPESSPIPSDQRHPERSAAESKDAEQLDPATTACTLQPPTPINENSGHELMLAAIQATASTQPASNCARMNTTSPASDNPNPEAISTGRSQHHKEAVAALVSRSSQAVSCRCRYRPERHQPNHKPRRRTVCARIQIKESQWTRPTPTPELRPSSATLTAPIAPKML